MTSGNISDEPQCIGNAEATRRLAGIADHFLLHDRDIERRVDDSVVRAHGWRLACVAARARLCAGAVGDAGRLCRRPAHPCNGRGVESRILPVARGPGCAVAPYGRSGELPTFIDYARSIEQYRTLFAHAPRGFAVDCHREYLSTKLGQEMAAQAALPIIEVQHHHAHIAACMAENGVTLDAGPVIGVALDGLGWGADGTIWGGEFLLADYRGFRRLACFKPVAMPGGAQASREPWRNAYAHIVAAMGWPDFSAKYGRTELGRYLNGKPLATIEGMIARRVNAPLASSCGRLFDAVAAVVGLCRDRVQYEGQAAMQLEALAEQTVGAKGLSVRDHASRGDGRCIWTRRRCGRRCSTIWPRKCRCSASRRVSIPGWPLRSSKWSGSWGWADTLPCPAEVFRTGYFWDW